MKLKMRNLGLLALTAMLFLGGCSQGSDGSAESGEGDGYTLKLGTALKEGDPIYDGLVEFSNSVKEKTDGNVTIEIFGSGSLGEDNDVIEQAKSGANIAVVVDTGRLADMVPEIGILSAPYIVDDYEEASKVVQSDLFKEWENQLADEQNLQIVSFNWYQGERHMLTNKPITTPDDMKGLKIRTINAPVFLETMEALGASPAGIAWTEVYPGLQQNVIDAAEAQNPATYGAKLYEVADYLTKTRHFQLLTGIVASRTWMDSVPEEYQKVIYEEAQKFGEEASQNTVKSLEDYEKKMVDEGLKVNEVDVELFKEATDSVYDKFDGYRELQKEINNILGK